MNNVPSRKTRLVRVAKLVFRLLILALVAIGIWHFVLKAIDELQARQFSLADIRPWWLVVAGLAYLGGSVPSWLLWHRALVAMGQRPRRFESLRAFFIGHLGKYVPGKAMVVVLRTGLVSSDRCGKTVAAIGVFVETLTTMAVGAFVAAAVLGVLSLLFQGGLWLAPIDPAAPKIVRWLGEWFQEKFWPVLLSVAFMLVVGVPTLPPIFRRLVRMVGVKKMDPGIDAALAGLSFRVIFYGWLAVTLGWVLTGLSLWATLRAIPTATAIPVGWEHWPLATAIAALGVVAGFVSMLPGGVGIREYVVMTLLAGPFGVGAATISAVLSRLVWLLAEVAISAVLYGGKPGRLRAIIKEGRQELV
jgi:uncharacterized membrane protein YbhN (UPF0104 family)